MVTPPLDPVRVLLVEDDEDDYLITRDMLLRSLGCEFGQGYLFSEALSAADTRVLLEGWSPSEIVALGSPV